MEYVCRICGNARGNRGFAVREMMFGTRESFDYFECPACDCLQIAEIPADPARYYPPGYYALSRRERPVGSRLSQVSERRRAAGGLGRGGPLDRLWASLAGVPPFIEWARHAGAGFGDAILDVGSGSGQLLQKMAQVGFTQLTGIDPHIESNLEYVNGVRVFRRELADEPGCYRLVMLHHALEHLPDPEETLRAARHALEPGGCLLIRTPVKDSFAWEEYGVDWVQLDAPRHIFLFSQTAMRRIAERAGLSVERVVHDSTAFQLWGSELYRRDIALQTRSDGGRRSARHHFSRRELRAFKRRASALNREGRGDQACVYLRP
jgi:SAM-dependent methyltransferase